MLHMRMSADSPYNLKYERRRFLEGARIKNIPQVKSKSIWQKMKFFARYSYNKSEIFSLVVTTYWTAWLKVHFKEEFMGAIHKMEAVNENAI